MLPAPRSGRRSALQDGVTGFVDAGSAGADRIDETVAVAQGARRTWAACSINIARTGILPGGELMDLNRADVALVRGAIARHRDVVVGVKARLSDNVVGTNDLEALRRAQEAAAPFDLPVMIHMGQSVSPMRAILPLLKRGDIVTHMYAPPPNGILDDNGRLLPEVLAARRRGIWFDFGNGRNGHVTLGRGRAGDGAGLRARHLLHRLEHRSRARRGRRLPRTSCRSSCCSACRSSQVIARATVNAARVFDVFSDRGTLNVGAPADVAILELRDGTFEFVDNYEGKRTGRQRLFPIATVIGGKRAPPRA